MPQIIHVYLPVYQLCLLLTLPPIALGLAVARLRRRMRRRSARGEDPDWSVPQLDATATGSYFHSWDVRCKIVTILCYSFMVASLRHMGPAAAAAGVSLLAMAASRPKLSRVVMRLLAIAGFVGMFLVVMPFTAVTRPTDTLVVLNGWDLLAFNLRGLELAGTIAIKAVAITLLMEPLLSTAPLPITLQGLSRLGAPEVVGQMVLLSHRYLNVFRHEARRMAAGMRIRGFRKGTDLETVRAVSSFLGMLFVRSFERTERVFDAMRARGYRGRFPETAEFHLHTRDVLLAVIWGIVGVVLVVWDRTGG